LFLDATKWIKRNLADGTGNLDNTVRPEKVRFLLAESGERQGQQENPGSGD